MARPLVDSPQYMQMLMCKSNWTGQYSNISHNNYTFGEIDTTHLQSTAHTNIPSDIGDAGEISVDYNWNSDDPPPIGVQQKIILCNPPTGTYSGTAFTLITASNTWTPPGTIHPGYEAVDGFVKSYGKKYPNDPSKMEGTMTIRLSGTISRYLAGATGAS